MSRKTCTARKLISRKIEPNYLRPRTFLRSGFMRLLLGTVFCWVVQTFTWQPLCIGGSWPGVMEESSQKRVLQNILLNLKVFANFIVLEKGKWSANNGWSILLNPNMTKTRQHYRVPGFFYFARKMKICSTAVTRMWLYCEKPRRVEPIRVAVVDLGLGGQLHETASFLLGPPLPHWTWCHNPVSTTKRTLALRQASEESACFLRRLKLASMSIFHSYKPETWRKVNQSQFISQGN